MTLEFGARCNLLVLSQKAAVKVSNLKKRRSSSLGHKLGGGFKHFYFSPLFGEDFD